MHNLHRYDAGTKSVEECIHHFIRLPIEDRFLDDIAGGGGAVGLCTLNQVDPYPIAYSLSNP
jgi:hypothetical protein